MPVEIATSDTGTRVPVALETSRYFRAELFEYIPERLSQAVMSETGHPGWAFIRELDRLYSENSVLKQVVINQWHTYKYNQEYIS